MFVIGMMPAAVPSNRVFVALPLLPCILTEMMYKRRALASIKLAR